MVAYYLQLTSSQCLRLAETPDPLAGKALPLISPASVAVKSAVSEEARVSLTIAAGTWRGRRSYIRHCQRGASERMVLMAFALPSTAPAS